MGLGHQKNLHGNIQTMATLAAHVTFNLSDTSLSVVAQTSAWFTHLMQLFQCKKTYISMQKQSKKSKPKQWLECANKGCWTDHVALTLSLKGGPLCYWCCSLLVLEEGIFRADDQPAFTSSYCCVKPPHLGAWSPKPNSNRCHLKWIS